MKAAYPYIDDFLPAGTVARLERLGEILAGASQGTARRGDGRHARDDASRPRWAWPHPDAAPPAAAWAPDAGRRGPCAPADRRDRSRPEDAR